MEPAIDSRVVRTIRSLRKLQALNDSFSTRTSTPSHESQMIEIICNRDELSSLKEAVCPSDIFEIIKNDQTIVRDLMTEPVLSPNKLRKIQEKINESVETKKIQIAKQSINAKLQERMESLKKQLADSNSD